MPQRSGRAGFASFSFSSASARGERSASPTRRMSRCETHERDGGQLRGRKGARGQGGRREPSTCWCWPPRPPYWRWGACAGCARGAWPNARGDARKLHMPQNGKPPVSTRDTGGFSKRIRQRPTLPRGFPRSTIGSGGLNFRVRDGNGWDPSDIATGKQATVHTKGKFQFIAERSLAVRSVSLPGECKEALEPRPWPRVPYSP